MSQGAGMAEGQHSTGYYHLTVAARMVGLSPTRVRHFVRVGLIEPARIERGAALLGEAELARLRKLRRLTLDLGLNTAGCEVALRLLDEIEALRNELRRLERR